MRKTVLYSEHVLHFYNQMIGNSVIRHFLLLSLTLFNIEKASANLCSGLFTSSTSISRQFIRESLKKRPENLWLSPLLIGPLPNPTMLKARLKAIEAVENKMNPDEPMQYWEIEEPKNLRSLGLIQKLIPQKQDFDQYFQFIITSEAIIHVPNSPDSLSRAPYVYFFQGERLQKRMLLDEWIILNFKKTFGNSLILYRTMSEHEAVYYRDKDKESLLKQMQKNFETRQYSYNAGQPTLHFAAEQPISWTRKTDKLFRFEIDIGDLISAIRAGHAKVGLYGTMLEV